MGLETISHLNGQYILFHHEIIDDKFIKHIIRTTVVGDKRGKELNNDELTFLMKTITNK